MGCVNAYKDNFVYIFYVFVDYIINICIFAMSNP